MIFTQGDIWYTVNFPVSYSTKLFGVNCVGNNAVTDYLYNYSAQTPVTWRVYGTTLESFVVGSAGADIHWGTFWLSIGY